MLDHRRRYYCRALQQYCGTQNEGGLKILFKDDFTFKKLLVVIPRIQVSRNDVKTHWFCRRIDDGNYFVCFSDFCYRIQKILLKWQANKNR